MSRAKRLLDLIQILRNNRYPVTGQVLADNLNISLRTLYRDIQTLQTQGANIEGEAGLGYVLRPGFTLPPLMFTENELEALVLGSRWVADRADTELQEAARHALSKIAAVLPNDLRRELDAATLLIGPNEYVIKTDAELALIRQSIRNEQKLSFAYKDQHKTASNRTVWPFAIGFFDSVRVVVTWCELRQNFRCFRVDRMESIIQLNERYPQNRQTLLKQWRKIENISCIDDQKDC